MVEKKKKPVVGVFSITVDGGKVIEREFFLNGYNPETRYSIDVRDSVESIIEEIQYQLKMKDVNLIYDKFYGQYGLKSHKDKYKEVTK